MNEAAADPRVAIFCDTNTTSTTIWYQTLWYRIVPYIIYPHRPRRRLGSSVPYHIGTTFFPSPSKTAPLNTGNYCFIGTMTNLINVQRILTRHTRFAPPLSGWATTRSHSSQSTPNNTSKVKDLIHQAQTRDTATHLQADRDTLWHPYTSTTQPTAVLPIQSAQGCHLTLETGEILVDGMASWWSVIHGYRHKRLDTAVVQQMTQHAAHVMFGGLTHRPAVTLGELLVALTPESLSKVFLADSGSVSVEVALKMALQYQRGRGRSHKTEFIALQSGYHGDTMGAMSVCDPVNGMHGAFAANLMKNRFLPRPPCDEQYSLMTTTQQPDGGCHGCTCHRQHNDGTATTSYEAALEQTCRIMEDTIAAHAPTTAAVIVEPLVQGAGGMRFYDKRYLQRLRAACTAHDVLLICDEIATGFGRSTSSGGDKEAILFASQEAGIEPDIFCVGKALTAGYMTLAACLATDEVAAGVSASPADGPALPLMHGPTFMGNPLACAVAVQSLNLLTEETPDGIPFYQEAVPRVEAHLRQALQPATELDGVADVRVRGAIGVIELKKPIDMTAATVLCKEKGAWLRPFGRLVYTMPPYIATASDLDIIADTMMALAELK